MLEVDDKLMNRIMLNRKIEKLEDAIKILEDVKDDIAIKYYSHPNTVIELLEIYVEYLKKEIGEK